jgi:CheY-like chemotaxis protein
MPSQQATGEIGGPGRRALVAATDPATLRRCRDILEGFGLTVTAVDSGIGAVVAARDSLPDLILIDGQLRDVPGREAIRWLRSNPELVSIPIIVLSMNAKDDAIPAVAPSDLLLRRPVPPETLRRMIREVLK